MDRKKLFECVKIFEVEEDGLETGDFTSKGILCAVRGGRLEKPHSVWA